MLRRRQPALPPSEPPSGSIHNDLLGASPAGDPFADLFDQTPPPMPLPPNVHRSKGSNWPLTRGGTTVLVGGLVLLAAGLGIGLKARGGNDQGGTPRLPTPGLEGNGLHPSPEMSIAAPPTEQPRTREIHQQSMPFELIGRVSRADEEQARNLSAAQRTGQQLSEADKQFLDKYYERRGTLANADAQITELGLESNKAEFITALQLRSGLKINFYQSRLGDDRGHFVINPEGMDVLATRVLAHMSTVDQSYLSKEQVADIQARAARGGYDNEVVSVVLSNNNRLCSADQNNVPFGYEYNSEGKCTLAGITKYRDGVGSFYNINPLVLTAATHQDKWGSSFDVFGHEMGHTLVPHSYQSAEPEENMMYAIQKQLAGDYSGPTPLPAPFTYVS